MHVYNLAFNKITFPILRIGKLSVNNTLYNQKKGRKAIKILTNVSLKAIFNVLLTQYNYNKKNKGNILAKRERKYEE